MVDLPKSEYEERVTRSRFVRSEARATISEQTETLSDIDEKAIQICRLNILLTGVIATAFSIAITEGVIENFPHKTEIAHYSRYSE